MIDHPEGALMSQRTYVRWKSAFVLVPPEIKGDESKSKTKKLDLAKFRRPMITALPCVNKLTRVLLLVSLFVCAYNLHLFRFYLKAKVVYIK